METLDFEVNNKVDWIQMNRPVKHNPFDNELRADLMTVLEQVRNDSEIRALVLTGSAGAFCAGGNLHVLREHPARPTGSSASGMPCASYTTYSISTGLSSRQSTGRQ